MKINTITKEEADKIRNTTCCICKTHKLEFIDTVNADKDAKTVWCSNPIEDDCDQFGRTYHKYAGHYKIID